MLDNPIFLLFQVIQNCLGFYLALLFIRILLSWFPNINWFDPPFSILSQLTDPYLNIFRSIIPPLGGLDFSAILALLLLQVVQSTVLPLIAQLLVGSQVGY
ncbi:YggT family protein [Phormidium sp. FACHB-592]|uniref:YggT family protein n=1 Tax=Stenomitos frigidus AS-A4 TaxID=2933935 RepID=A0ABV0KHS9_9CYAN|nr:MULTISPECIES: YggT family protein [Cyanophyceae]MBD2035268.1 YggT family protein [Leptolyngbya sp. FACHB-321]MBD2073969.1 YggT family protein [Phormidium sp. FACHB-592]